MLTMLEELDGFFKKYGQLERLGSGRIADCLFEYSDGFLRVTSPRQISAWVGPDVFKNPPYVILDGAVSGCRKEVSKSPWFLCRIHIQTNGTVLGCLSYMGRWGLNEFAVDCPTTTGLICDYLLGRPVPILDWLIDHDFFLKQHS